MRQFDERFKRIETLNEQFMANFEFELPKIVKKLTLKYSQKTERKLLSSLQEQSSLINGLQSNYKEKLGLMREKLFEEVRQDRNAQDA